VPTDAPGFAQRPPERRRHSEAFRLYHLNAEDEPELPDYPKDLALKKQFGLRGGLHCWADGKGGQKIKDTGPLPSAWKPSINLDAVLET
jgi:hypothetical protein